MVAERRTFYGLNEERMATYEHQINGTSRTVVTTSVWFGGKLAEMNGQRVEQDRLGSVVVHGTERLSYWPYGQQKPGTTAQNRQKFASCWRDETGLDYAMNRYYSGGRFLSPDPHVASGGAREPNSWNRYAYVEGDPGSYWDPGGLCKAEAGTSACFSSIVTATAPSSEPVSSHFQRTSLGLGADLVMMEIASDGVVETGGDWVGVEAEPPPNQPAQPNPRKRLEDRLGEMNRTATEVRRELYTKIEEFWSLKGNISTGASKGGFVGAVEGALGKFATGPFGVQGSEGAAPVYWSPTGVATFMEYRHLGISIRFGQTVKWVTYRSKPVGFAQDPCKKQGRNSSKAKKNTPQSSAK
jgi:RHS repeat-associated protein